MVQIFDLVCVANLTTNQISIIDTSTDEIIDVLQLDYSINSLKKDNQNRLLVAVMKMV